MGNARLFVIIIETPDSQRSQPLLSILNDDTRFEVVRLPAVMLHANSDLHKYKITTCLDEFIFFQGRTMSPQEIGCAKSHNLARKLVADSLLGGVILEDDARIEDTERLYMTAMAFLQVNHNKSRVLSLNEFRVGGKSEVERNGFQPLLSKPFLALAYALTPLAALALYEANEPIRNVADWPRARVKYFSLFKSVVRHGDDESKSTIDIHGDLNRKGFTITKKLARYTFTAYFVSKPKTIPVLLYIEEVFWSSITWRFDSLLRRLLKVVSK